ncbi:MAG: hypothetical protein IT348_19345 [Candidatus Eisenbacteria bacterium]|nr:hypothetical protein [Candidatus Eisenbacteria bacterium]
MSSPAPDRLTDILDGLQARLEGELRGNRVAVAHPGARGEASEEDWLRVLKAHLPHRYQADRAFVIDSQGLCSDQIDVVIYDRQYSPLLFNQANQRYVPAESVYAVLEVKQDLNREHVLYAADKAASVRRLHRTSAPVPHVEGVAKPRPLPPIVAGILTYQSSWTPPFGDSLREALAELTTDRHLDIGCALIHGAFEARYSVSGGVDLTVIDGSRSLLQCFMRLLKQLQALATAPAIEYEAYLARFRGDGRGGA